MARTPTTADVFNAVAEPRRREIIRVLAGGQARAVGELTDMLHLSQPTMSKHLRVLRDVGVVSAVKQGQHRLYRLEPRELKPIHDWVKVFEQYWATQLDRIKERAERDTQPVEETPKRTHPRKERP